MIPPLRHTSFLNGATVALVGLSVVLFLRLAIAVRRSVPPPVPQVVFRPETAFPEAPSRIEPQFWDVLSSSGEPPGAVPGDLSRRFRLAGTLFGFGVGSAETPQAILDDKLLVVQRLIRRGDEVLSGIRLVDVRTDAVVLEGPAGCEEIRLEHTGGASAGSATLGRAGTEEGAGFSASPTDRFGGKLVFPGRWEFDRQSLLGYYSELRDEPDRLLAVFDSMEPLYFNEDPSTRNITGYRLNVKGEAPLFEATGMQAGDVVRSVNSVEMNNRRRAENFIRAFVENEEDTFVIEVERNGVLTKQVYIIR